MAPSRGRVLLSLVELNERAASYRPRVPHHSRNAKGTRADARPLFLFAETIKREDTDKRVCNRCDFQDFQALQALTRSYSSPNALRFRLGNYTLLLPAMRRLAGVTPRIERYRVSLLAHPGLVTNLADFAPLVLATA